VPEPPRDHSDQVLLVGSKLEAAHFSSTGGERGGSLNSKPLHAARKGRTRKSEEGELDKPGGRST